MKGGMPDRRVMEQQMAQIQQLLEEQEFSSEEEMNQFLQAQMKGGKLPTQEPSTPLEKAQSLVHQAFDARGRRQLLLAREALKVSEDCADAYVILAERTSDMQKACDLYRKGILAGERTLGQEFIKKEAGHFWGLLQTRPYMRARLGLAQSLEAMDSYAEAAEHYREMLRLNPNDNQGVRDILLRCLLMNEQDQEVESLLNKYKSDKGMALWSYAKALVSFRRHGESKRN